MSRPRDVEVLRGGRKTLTREIDQLLLGVSPDRLDRQAELSPEDREILQLAYRLTNAQLAERSRIREPLRDRLIYQIEERQEIKPKMERERVVKRQSNNWRIILIIAAALVLLALIVGAIAVMFVSSRPAPPAPEIAVQAYDDAAPPVMHGYTVFPVYDIQGVTFGEVIRLEQMVVRFEPYNSSPDVDSIILIWEAIGPIPPGRYAVVVEAIDLETGEERSEETVEVSLPTESGTALATEHDISRYAAYTKYQLSVFDRETNERLPMADGAEYLELRAVPSSIVPQAPGNPNAPTAVPPATPTFPPTPTLP